MANFVNKYLAIITLVIILVSTFIGYALDNDFKEKRSTHFIVFYKDNVDKDFVDDVIDSAESYYEEIADNLGFRRFNFWLWDERAEIYIFSDKSSYLSATNAPQWSGGCASYQEKKLWTYPHAAGFFDSVLPHELGHIIFREFVGFYNNVPLWFEEGVASYQERSKRYAADTIVKEAIVNNKLLSCKELNNIKNGSNIDSQRVEVFYAQAVSIISYLIKESGKDKFARLCQRIKEKETIDKALDMTYFSIKDSKDLYDKWLKSFSK